CVSGYIARCGRTLICALSDVETLSRRVAQLEAALAGNDIANPQKGDSQAPPESPPARKPPGHVHPIPRVPGLLGPNWYFNGIPLSSKQGCHWISTKTGQDISLFDLCIPRVNDCPLWSVQSALSHINLDQLPERLRVQEILNEFIDSCSMLGIPILNRETLARTMDVAYKPTDWTSPSSEQILATACLLSALSMASRLANSRQSFMEVDNLESRALHYLVSLGNDASLDTLQTALLLSLQHVFCADWEGASHVNSIACRIVCSLQGHVVRPQQLAPDSIQERLQIRNLFWVCYALDKEISLRTGSPPLLVDVYCDLSPPRATNDTTSEMPGECEGSLYQFLPRFLGDIHLSKLKERIFKLLFSAQALNEHDGQILTNIRQLDEEAEIWRASIPEPLRPALFVLPDTNSRAANQVSPTMLHRISLQLQHQHLMIIIHTMVRRCTLDASDGIRGLHDVAHSSFDISLEAGRSTLWCLRYLIHRFIALYCTPAAFAIFLDILIHPFSAHASRDLELLISTANAVQNMPVDALTTNEKAQIHATGTLLMRFVWLGTCAIMKEKGAPS
ncbi:hypothetical protein N7468_005795, partial [Penicillium chermesinum]